MAARLPQQHVECLTPTALASMHAKQIETLHTLRSALIANGVTSLREQARALCLPRSTAWFILQSNHKCTGLNAALVVRMLRSDQLPEDARKIVIRYVQERLEGAYGHNELLRQKFVMRLEKLGWPAPVPHPAS